METIGQCIGYRNAFFSSNHFHDWSVTIHYPVMNHLRTLRKHVKVKAVNELNGEICHCNRFSRTPLFERIERDVNLFELREIERKMIRAIEMLISANMESSMASRDDLFFRFGNL